MILIRDSTLRALNSSVSLHGISIAHPFKLPLKYYNIRLDLSRAFLKKTGNGWVHHDPSTKDTGTTDRRRVRVLKLQCFGSRTWIRLKGILCGIKAGTKQRPRYQARAKLRTRTEHKVERWKAAPCWTPRTSRILAPKGLWRLFCDENVLWGDLDEREQETLSRLLRGR